MTNESQTRLVKHFCKKFGFKMAYVLDCGKICIEPGVTYTKANYHVNPNTWCSVVAVTIKRKYNFEKALRMLWKILTPKQRASSGLPEKAINLLNAV